MRRQRELAHFVEEYSAAVGGFEQACARLKRARERPLFVPEQLALEQGFTQRRAVDTHEWPGGARRVCVNGAREHFFADARLAEQKHADGGARCPRCLGV